MKAGSSLISSNNYIGPDPIVILWVWRILVPLHGYRDFVQNHGFSDDRLAEVLGLGEWVDPEDKEYNKKHVINNLLHKYKGIENEYRNVCVSKRLVQNIQRLSEMVELTSVDCRILELIVLINIERILDDAADWLGPLSMSKMNQILSVVLGIPDRDIQNALSPQGALARSGLMSIERRSMNSLRSKVELLSDNFADHIYFNDADPVRLLKGTVSESVPPELSLNDFQYIQADLDILIPYLKRSMAMERKGVNVFIHGSPGTGKSQLVKVLAEHFDCELFEVASEDEAGEPIDGVRRLRAYSAAQSFFSKRKVVLLFDEVEDVFDDGNWFLGNKSTAQKRKAWINRILENNEVVTFWLSNNVDGLDTAFIRRFDMILELPIPGKLQRRRIVKEYCSEFLSDHAINRVADVEQLAPAIVSRAASVACTIRDELGETKVSDAFEHIVSNTLQTQGFSRIRRCDPNQLPEIYDPAFINADIDIDKIANGLMTARSGRLLIYGPPGTGKTAYGRWLGDQMDVPLLLKRGSDLISKWYGDTEKNISEAFREAESEGAILMIDEIDGFLRDRRGASRSWEVTQVNEMLTQMESYPGVFVASTNLIDGLDQAALRRFDLKMKFDYMRVEQIKNLIKRQCEILTIPVHHIDDLHVNHLTNVTPGDFATILRRHRFQPLLSVLDVIDALEHECSFKEGAKRAIGFM